MALAPGTKLGPYQILGALGSGGMGEVYRARDERLARDVALKILPPSFAADPDRLRRFEQEARATGQLNHPNILAIHDAGVHDGIPYVVAELLEGETLRQRLSGSPLPARKVVDYATQTARGLAAAHQRGIVHRDLKPENLFVTSDGRIKILDFGLAKLGPPAGSPSLLSDAPTLAETGAGVVVGTAGYMSPEQVRGQPIDPRSDIFSLGSILFEMATGRRAFQADSAVETMNAILKEEPHELSRPGQDLPAGLDRIVRHCMEKSPDERFQSARDLAFQLEALSSVSSAAAAPVVWSARARPARVRTAAIAAALLAVAFLAGVWGGRRGRPEPGEASYSQLTFRKGSLTGARFTPDGETVVYSASWDGGPVELYSTRPGSPESRPLGMRSAEIVSVSRAGEMAVLLNSRTTIGFQRVGTLARAPLAGGVPREVLEHVQDADWAPDGQGFAVAHEVNQRYRLEYPIGTTLYETERWINAVRFSRDGKRIAFIDHPLNGDNRGRVAVVDLGAKLTVLTEPFGTATGLAWSPSGEEIWFTAAKTGNVASLYAVDLAGRVRMVDGAPANLALADVSPGGAVLVIRDDARRGIVGRAPGESTERDLSWLDWSRPSDLSSDGRFILFEEQGQGGGAGYSVYLRGTDGSPAVKLGGGVSLALSPDGRWVATRPLEDPPGRLVIFPTGAGETRSVTVPLVVLSLHWLPDGKRFLVHGSEEGQRSRLYLVPVEGGTPRAVTPEGTKRFYAASPAGDAAAACVEGGACLIFPFDGGEPRAIRGMLSDEEVISCSEDGRSLLVARMGTPPLAVEWLDWTTGERRPWRVLAPADAAGAQDITFVQVSSDAAAYAFSYRRILSTLYLATGLR